MMVMKRKEGKINCRQPHTHTHLLPFYPDTRDFEIVGGERRQTLSLSLSTTSTSSPLFLRRWHHQHFREFRPPTPPQQTLTRLLLFHPKEQRGNVFFQLFLLSTLSSSSSLSLSLSLSLRCHGWEGEKENEEEEERPPLKRVRDAQECILFPSLPLSLSLSFTCIHFCQHTSFIRLVAGIGRLITHGRTAQPISSGRPWNEQRNDFLSFCLACPLSNDFFYTAKGSS